MSESQRGKKFTKEHRDKLSKYRKEHPVYRKSKASKEEIERRSAKRKIPIIQYDLDMNFIKEWNGAVDAARALHINNRNIASCCIGKRQKVGGFKWKYKNK